jgi:phage I-like protein
MDAGKPSEAAGWVGALEARDDGLWAKIRWTDAGLAAVTGGRYRLVSPVFPEPSACEDLGGGRIRPRRLVSVALTNEPNIKGGKPIANRCPDAEGHGQARTDTDGHGLTQTEKERPTSTGWRTGSV